MDTVKIDARDVNFWYGDFHALKGISMQIEEKSVVAFIGPSGCGKSTFLRLFNRMNDLIPATRLEGEIRIDGQNIYAKGVEVDELRKNVGMVFQRPNPFPKSIFENVAYGLRARANLVMQNWAAAYEDATKALGGYTPYTREEVSKPGFVDSNDHNWMWALILTPTNMPDAYPSWPSVISSFSGDSYSAGVGCYKMINTLLYTKIPDTDVRKGWWVDENLDSPNLKDVSWRGYDGQPIGPLVVPDVKMAFYPYTNVKFGAYQGILGNNINAGDWCMMRAEEMILIQAEAKAMSGDLGGGKRILEDFVKNYRDPSYTSKATSVAGFQDEVWMQRRIELWGEGFALFDILRLQKNVVRFNNRVESNFPDGFKFNLAANNGWLLMRIPRNEINANNGISEADTGCIFVRLD